MAQNLFQQLGKERTVFGESWENFSEGFLRQKAIDSTSHKKSHTIHGTGIFTYIWLIFMVNVGNYTIHGWYGYL